MLGRERERDIIHKVFSVLLIFREMAIGWPYSGELLTYHLKLLRCTSLQFIHVLDDHACISCMHDSI